MTTKEVNFSKIVRSLLLDLDVCMDQLEQIGYFSADQRAFLDKFLYKSEDALRAANLVRVISGSGLPLTKLPSIEESSPRGLALSPSRSENGASNVTSRAPPRQRSGTEQLKSEENGLATFLKRCNARNFSVKVRGTDTGKESPNKGKGSDYILTLEPIAEGNAKGYVSSGNAIVDDNKFLGRVNYNTNMMLQGAESPREINAESVDYEKIIDTDAVANSSQENTKHTIDEGVGIEPATNDTSSAKAIDIMAASVEPTNVNLVVEPIKVEPTDLKHAESQQNTEDATKINLAGTEATMDQEQSHNNDLWDKTNALEGLATKTEEEVESNAWGKPVKPDPTRSKEGAIVGGKASPLGAENRGRAMMGKMGWCKGTGLGKQKGGILEPITHVVKNTKTGLHTQDDEKKHATALSPLSSENTPNSTSYAKAEEKPANLDNVPKSTAVNRSNWDEAVKPIAKKLEAGAKPTAVGKHAEELNKAGAGTSPAKPQFAGIKALYLREGNSPGPEKTISFRTRIQSTNEHKTTMHRPGVIIRAISPQGSHYSKSTDDSSFSVWTGNALEVLRSHQGDEYHVYNFRSKRRGIVKISLLEMIDEPKAVLADTAPLTNIPAAAAAWV